MKKKEKRPYLSFNLLATDFGSTFEDVIMSGTVDITVGIMDTGSVDMAGIAIPISVGT